MTKHGVYQLQIQTHLNPQRVLVPPNGTDMFIITILTIIPLPTKKRRQKLSVFPTSLFLIASFSFPLYHTFNIVPRMKIFCSPPRLGKKRKCNEILGRCRVMQGARVP